MLGNFTTLLTLVCAMLHMSWIRLDFSFGKVKLPTEFHPRSQEADCIQPQPGHFVRSVEHWKCQVSCVTEM